jgi:hypothetical protein
LNSEENCRAETVPLPRQDVVTPRPSGVIEARVEKIESAGQAMAWFERCERKRLAQKMAESRGSAAMTIS